MAITVKHVAEVTHFEYSRRVSLAEIKKGMARSDRGRKGGGFLDLLARATHDIEAYAAIADAYQGLMPHERRALIDATVRDCHATERSPAPILAAYLAVESDASLAKVVADELWRCEIDTEAPFGVVIGTEDAGEAWLVQPLHGHFGEALNLRWGEHGVDNVRVETLVDIRRFELESRLRPEQTIARLTERVWAFLKANGEIPDEANRFAHWFSL